MVDVFLSISDYLDPPSLRHLKPENKTPDEEDEKKEKEEKKESLMRIMLNNAFFVTHKGTKTTLCVSVLGKFLLKIKSCRDGSSVISAKLGERIVCTVNGDPRLCFFPENLVEKWKYSNLSTHKFAEVISGDPRNPIFTMNGNTIECRKFAINVNITEEILEYLLCDMDSLGGIIDDFMLPKSKEERANEEAGEKEMKVNLLSIAEEGYVIKEPKKSSGVRETKSMFYFSGQDISEEIKLKRLAKTSYMLSDDAEEGSDGGDDIKDVKNDAKNEFVENDIIEFRPSKDGPLAVKVNDCTLKLNIAATKRATAHTSNGAVIIFLDVSEIVYSSGYDPASKDNKTYIRFFARDFNVVDYSYVKENTVSSTIKVDDKEDIVLNTTLKFDDRRRDKWKEVHLKEGVKLSDEDKPMFGIFSENRIAFYYREAGSRLKLRLSMHPIEVSFLWNEINIINDYYSIYANASKVISERKKALCCDDCSNEFKIRLNSDTRIKIESLHLWRVGVKLTLKYISPSDGSFDDSTESDYIPLISNSLCSSLRLIDAERAPWHLNPIVLKSDSTRTFYKDDIPEIFLSYYKNDYSLGRILRAVMHIGILKNALKLGKAVMLVVSVPKEDEGSFAKTIGSGFLNLGETIFDIGADSANSLFLLAQAVDENLSPGTFKSFTDPKDSQVGVIDGIKRFFGAVTKGFLAGLEAITLDPIQAYQDRGATAALKKFSQGILCTVIRPVEGSLYGISILFYGARNSISPKKSK